MSDSITLFVPGVPVPGGSKRGFPVHRANGTVGIAMSDASGLRGKEWRARIALAAREQAPPALFDGPLAVTMVFVMLRPRGDWRKSGLLRTAARTSPTIRPDLLKLARAVEDALTGVLWRDDAQIVQELLAKVYGETPGVQVRVYPGTGATHPWTDGGTPAHG